MSAFGDRLARASTLSRPRCRRRTFFFPSIIRKVDSGNLSRSRMNWALVTRSFARFSGDSRLSRRTRRYDRVCRPPRPRACAFGRRVICMDAHPVIRRQDARRFAFGRRRAGPFHDGHRALILLASISGGIPLLIYFEGLRLTKASTGVIFEIEADPRRRLHHLGLLSRCAPSPSSLSRARPHGCCKQWFSGCRANGAGLILFINYQRDQFLRKMRQHELTAADTPFSEAGDDRIFPTLEGAQAGARAVAYVTRRFRASSGIDIVAQRFAWPDLIERALIIAACIGFFPRARASLVIMANAARSGSAGRS